MPVVATAHAASAAARASQAIRAAMAALLVLALSGGVAPRACALDQDEARHLLARTGFAPTPDEIAPLLPLTREQAVDHLLAGARTTSLVAPPPWCLETLAEHASVRALENQQWGELSEEERRARYQQREKRDRDRGVELKAWWYQEMISTDSPLTERMVLFWHNHFTSALATVGDPLLMYEQNRLLRANALGNFGSLLAAMPEDPAMFIYLDSNSNVQDRPNENFAREVMELFTVGEGYYSEQDIKEAARCLSGYKIDDATGRPALTERYHDPGRKSVLGSDGVFDADAVMALLLQKQERVAIHIAEKVWQEFIAEDLSPPATQQAIYQLAAAFYHANYDLTVLLRTALLEPDFWALPNRGSLVRSPVELLVGTVRQLDLPVPDALTLVGMGRQLGEDVLDPPNVKGWKGGSAWISTQSLLARRQVLSAIASGGLGAIHDRATRTAAASDSAPPPMDAAPAATDAMQSAAPRSAGPIADHGAWLEPLRARADGGVAILAVVLLPLPPVQALPTTLPFAQAVKAVLLDPTYNLK